MEWDSKWKVCPTPNKGYCDEAVSWSYPGLGGCTYICTLIHGKKTLFLDMPDGESEVFYSEKDMLDYIADRERKVYLSWPKPPLPDYRVVDSL